MSLNPQMDILYMQGPGHVLGIFTRTSEPVQMETDASAFAGDGLPLTISVAGQNLVMPIPPGLIQIFRAGRVWSQIFQPLTLYASGPSTPPQLMTFVAVAPALNFASPNLTMTLTTGITANILVLAFDTVGGAPLQFNSQITAPPLAVNVPLTGLVSGHTYNVLVFVPTFPIAAKTFTAP
jgi:hypothetical protein